MALLENRTGASVNPGNRQDNGQIVVFVAERWRHLKTENSLAKIDHLAGCR
jgi:hypothetical protein